MWNLSRYGTPLDFWKFVKRQGFTGLDLDLIDESGNYYFYSAALKSSKLHPQQDLLSDVLDSLDKPENPFHGAAPKISFNFSLLARASRDKKLKGTHRLSAGRIQKLAAGFSQNYLFTDLISEPFPDSVQNFLYLSGAETKKSVNMIASAPAFGDYLMAYASIDKKFTRAPDRFITDDSSSTVGLGDLLFAFGKTMGKEVWAGSRNSNLLLYRAAQGSAQGYWINTFREALGNDLLEFCCPKETGPKKPLANLVFSSAKNLKFDFSEFADPILNVLLASGYDIQITFDQILNKADLYYIVGNEDWRNNLPFFDQVLRLLDHKKSRFYGPVVLHPLVEIKRGARWDDLRAFFNIPATDVGWESSLPETVTENGRRIRWRGANPKGKGGMSFIRAEAVRNNHGEVMLSELVGTNTLALILKSGSRVLINGNLLHLEAAFFLARAFGGALEAPAMAHITSGRTRTSAFAVEDTRLQLKIPCPEPPENWRKIIFDDTGKRIEDVLIAGSDRVDVTFKSGSLLILEKP